MLSSAGLRSDAERRCRLGIAAYLTKPFKPSDLLDAILTVLGTIPQTNACGNLANSLGNGTCQKLQFRSWAVLPTMPRPNRYSREDGDTLWIRLLKTEMKMRLLDNRNAGLAQTI